MLSATKRIIQEAEILILGEFDKSIPSVVSKFLTDFYYIFAGLRLLFLPIKQFLIVFISLWVASYLLASYFSLNKETKDILVFLSFSIPIAIVVFARPSKFCFDQISDKKVNQLAQTIKSNGIFTKYDLGVLMRVIDLAKDRVEKRNKKFNWLFGSYIAICIFIFNYYWKLAINIGDFDFQEFINSVTLPFFLFMLFTPFLYALINSYKKGNDAVFQLIYLTINELESTFNKQAEARSQRKKHVGRQ